MAKLERWDIIATIMDSLSERFPAQLAGLVLSCSALMYHQIFIGGHPTNVTYGEMLCYFFTNTNVILVHVLDLIMDGHNGS